MSATTNLPGLGDDHEYVIPKKEILEPEDLQRWIKSEAYHEYVGFLECLNEAVRGKSQSHLVNESPTITILLGILEKLSRFVDEIPPIDQPQRFGNQAFRTWYERLAEHAEPLLRSALPDKYHKAISEISIYLIEGFGNSTRIDYGTGHEMSFIIFLYCIFRIGALDINSMDDKVAAVTKVFDSYMTLSRKLQVTYRMEPAGSHGAWSLDDYQFVPFIWGSSQLIGNPSFEPRDFIEEDVIEDNKYEYLFFGCLDYITRRKTGPFFEHSTQLWNISGTQSWTKVNEGLFKMYKAEVLAKHPVIQHTFFGTIFSVKEAVQKVNAPGPVSPKGLADDHEHVVPKKEILEPEDLQRWIKSEAYHEYVGFLECLNEAVRGKASSHPVNQSPAIAILLGILEKLSRFVDEIPPIDQPQRFGNKAFRTWYERLAEYAEPLLRSALPRKYHKAIPEISIYLIESFGNSTRIDYGTGHEMSFIIFLYCIFRIGALDINSMDDKVAAVTKVFDSYMTLSRKLQVTYRMEPAGSHGAWSLDDYQFVPFIWGSSQLIGNPSFEPHNFTEEEVIRDNKSEYLFFGCLDYIMRMKTGPFYEHSTQLWNISGTQSWTKVNQGLLKMYKAEVLAKHPVIQHTFFGTIFSAKEAVPKVDAPGGGPGGFRRPLPKFPTSASTDAPM